MRYGWMLWLVALAAADPARADVTARFRQPDGPPIIIQVNDRGDSRMAVTDGVYVTRDGLTHMILTDPEGTFVVAQEDFLAVLNAFLAELRPNDPRAPRPQVEIREGGSTSVGGRAGTVFRVGERGGADALEFVISSDPELAPVGRVFRAQLIPFMIAGGSGAPGLVEAMTDLLSRGALMRFGAFFELESVENAPVPSSAFALPGAPISREAFRTRMMGRER